MPYVAKNNARALLAAGLTNIATSATVAAGKGALFALSGSEYTYCALEDSSGNLELVKLTGVSGDTLTIVRAQGGTLARAWNIGDIIECRPCAQAMTDIQTAEATTAATAKTTPVDADMIPLADSAASNVLKKLSWANLKATLKTYMDTLYVAAAAIQAQTHTAYTTGGSSTAYTLTPSPALSALAENQEFDVEFHTAAGATPTLAVSGLTAKLLKYRDGTGAKQAIASAQVPSGWRSRVTYDGTDYIVREVLLVIPSALPAGAIVDFPTSSAPTGFLKANGAGVLVASYGDLTTNIYCGDGANATALHGFRADNADGSSRNTAGAYLILPDYRGEFRRGWDDSRGIDSGRAINTAQAQDVQPHTHSFTTHGEAAGGNDVMRSSGGVSSTKTTSSTGGVETRPRNVSVLTCIKY